MKLYTRPRPIYPHQLQPGDQIATFKTGGDLIRSATAYVDADLTGEVVWSVVHSTTPRESRRGWSILHTLGEHDVPNSHAVIVREVLELDPWSYVHGQNTEAQD